MDDGRFCPDLCCNAVKEAEIQGLAYIYNVRAGACKQVEVTDRSAGPSLPVA